MGRVAVAGSVSAATAGGFQLPLVLVVMAIQAQQFPVAAIGWIVAVIVIPMMDRQLAQVGGGEFAGTAAADPWIDLEGLLPVALLALVGDAASLGDYPVQLVRVARFHAVTCMGLGAMQLVCLGRHDEVVLVQTLNFLGLPGDLGPAPSEADVGMVSLALRQAADLGDEVHCFLEVLELEAPFNAVALARERPAGRLDQIAFGLGPRKRLDAAATRRTSLGR